MALFKKQHLSKSWSSLIEALGELYREIPESPHEVHRDYRDLLLWILREVTFDDNTANRLDMEAIGEWSLKFSTVNERWGMFVLLFQQRILRYV